MLYYLAKHIIQQKPYQWYNKVIITHARASGSWVKISSRMASEIWSQILSGWPSVTDSEVNRRCFAIFVPPWRWGVCIDIDSFLLVHQVYAMKNAQNRSSERCTLIFRFPAGFGTLCSHTGCRASQGLSPQPLLISRYSVCPGNILSLLRRNVKKSRTLF